MSSLAQSGAVEPPRAAVLSAAVRERVAPWLLVGLALTARLYRVAANGFRTDEIYSLWMAQRSLPELLRAIVLEGHDATPPTYYLLLHGMLQVSWQEWSARLISVLAGAALVGLTFLLARGLFDFDVALLTGLLLALSPISIDISQVARTYMLTAVLAVASVYFFARLRRPAPSRLTVWLFALCTIGAIATHYLAGLVLIVENLIVLALAVWRHLPRRRLLAWLKLQVVMALALLPLAWLAIQKVPTATAGHGQTWLDAPTPAGLIKSLILWGTGDPSYGPTGFTWARLASLIVVLALLALGVWTAVRLWRTRPEQRIEVGRVAFVAAVFLGIWGLAVGISLVRRIFDEQYFAYLPPLLLMLMAWSVLRLRPALLRRALLLSLAGLTFAGLYVFYTEPNGEQWREAMAYVRTWRQPGDVLVATPGYYIRSAGYYLVGNLPGADYTLGKAPYALVIGQAYSAADDAAEDMDLPDLDQALAGAERVWLVTGYSRPDPSRVAWFRQHYAVLSQQAFLGVRVMLGRQVDAPDGLPRFGYNFGRPERSIRAPAASIEGMAP